MAGVSWCGIILIDYGKERLERDGRIAMAA